MEAALRALLPRVLGDVSLDMFTYQGKPDLLRELPKRLRSQSSWLPNNWRIIVIVDADNDDCENLRRRLNRIATDSNLTVRAKSPSGGIATRIAIEELRGLVLWRLGSCGRRTHEYPLESSEKRGIVNSDRIRGGTWEAFERVLQAAGYFAEVSGEDRRSTRDRGAHGSRSQHFAELLQATRRLVGRRTVDVMRGARGKTLPRHSPNGPDHPISLRTRRARNPSRRLQGHVTHVSFVSSRQGSSPPLARTTATRTIAMHS